MAGQAGRGQGHRTEGTARFAPRLEMVLIVRARRAVPFLPPVCLKKWGDF
jgi:hypothetical protein